MAKKKRSRKYHKLTKKAAKVRTKKSALSGAMKDLSSEINKLSKEKAQHKRSLNRTSSAIDVDRRAERELQKKIARLIERESRLNQRKKKIQTKIDRVADKLNKINKIRSEMSDI